MEEGIGPLPSEPPPLPYSLHTRKKSIAFFWILFVIDTLGQPIALYWGLWYGTDLSHNLGMFVAAGQISTMELISGSSILHRDRMSGGYLCGGILLSSIQPVQEKLSRPAIERSEIMGMMGSPGSVCAHANRYRSWTSSISTLPLCG